MARPGTGEERPGDQGAWGPSHPRLARAVPCASFKAISGDFRQSRPISTCWGDQPRRGGAGPPERVDVLLQTEPAGIQGAAADRAITVRVLLQTEPLRVALRAEPHAVLGQSPKAV